MGGLVRAGGGDPFSEIALRLVDPLPTEQPWLVLACETHPVPPCSSTSSVDPAYLDFIGRMGEWRDATFGELLIDCEEDRTLRAVLVGILREADRGR